MMPPNSHLSNGSVQAMPRWKVANCCMQKETHPFQLTPPFVYFETPLKRKWTIQNDSPIKKGLHLHKKQRRLSQPPWRAGIWRGWSVRQVQYDPFECQFESQCFCERSLHATHLVATERTLASKTKPHVFASRSANDGMASWRPSCCCSYWYVRRTHAYYHSYRINTITLIQVLCIVICTENLYKTTPNRRGFFRHRRPVQHRSL